MASAELFLDSLLGPERRKTGWTRGYQCNLLNDIDLILHYNKSRIMPRKLSGLHAVTLIFNIITTFLHGCVAYASEKEITGFSQYHFGMTEREIENIVNTTHKENDSDHNLIVTALNTIDIAGSNYGISFTIKEDHLIAITLDSATEFRGGDKSSIEVEYYCNEHLRILLGLLKAKYGPPDLDPYLNVMNYASEFKDDFTSPAGARISIIARSSFVNPMACHITILYSAGDGNPF